MAPNDIIAAFIGCVAGMYGLAQLLVIRREAKRSRERLDELQLQLQELINVSKYQCKLMIQHHQEPWK